MKRLFSIVPVSILFALASAVPASASDVTEGEAYYEKQCALCHGSVKEEETGFNVPSLPPQRIQLAMLESVTTNTMDSVSQLIPVFDKPSYTNSTHERVAVAMPYGPNLRGIVGRPAGTVEGYVYSETMLKTLKGMEWSEAALNVWLTDTQAWVPGVYMYYKQEDPEVRRKIIEYLKANP